MSMGERMVQQRYVSSVLAPELLGAIAVAAYSYMALVPQTNQLASSHFGMKERFACNPSGKYLD